MFGTSLGNSMKAQMTIFVQITISWLPGTRFLHMMPFLQNLVYHLVGFASMALATFAVVPLALKYATNAFTMSMPFLSLTQKPKRV